MRRRPVVNVVATAVAVAVLAAGCSEEIDTAEVDPSGPSTTELARSTGNGQRVAGSPANGPNPTAPRRNSGATNASTQSSPQAQAALDLLTRIAKDPAGFARANGLNEAQLAQQLNVSPTTLQTLNISPSTVSALANLFTKLDPTTVDQLASGTVNPQIVTTVLSLLNSVNPQSLSGLSNIDPRALSVLANAASTLDPKIVDAFGNILAVSDPNGLGSLAGDKNSLALLTLLFGVSLRTDPAQFRQLSALNNLNPGFQFVIDGISSVVQAFDPRTVAFVNQVNDNFSPELLAALSGITAAISQPQVQAVLTEASKDPQLIANVVGVAALLIPGLAQVIVPEAFEANPNAQNIALVALLVTALGRLNGIDLTGLNG